MTRCEACNKKISLLVFTCQQCKSGFCSSHRLPEDHKCKELDARVRMEKERLRLKVEEGKHIQRKVEAY